MPVRFPTPAPNSVPADPIPNLVRESVHGDTLNNVLPSPAVPSYASNLNSASAAALDGRAVTAARWNSHFLIPSQSTATTADSTPDSAVKFTAPDWVLVTRNGPAVLDNSAVSGTGALSDATPTNGNFVIGRYAYAVYDEGGLLDMNVAGHPTPAATAAQSGFTPTQLSRKGSLALADLTQLPVVKTPNPASSGDYLAQSVVDSLVGWRNYASAGLSGAPYPNFTFSSTQAANWFTNFASKNVKGFLTVFDSGPSYTGPTDQAFLSRQQLLKLRASIGFSPNALQYMGTFSRGLEQPSYRPAHLRYPADAPSVNAVASTQPPGASSVSTYAGNNDAAGTLPDGTAGQDVINPSLLTVRVRNTFTRYDPPRTPAVIGEPLVKKKFPLSRLAEITYNAMDATPSVVDPAASHNHIKEWFGLSRTSASAAWTYDHGGTDANGRAAIMTLDKVAQANREPDFAELLKAAINAGSLAKGGPNLHNEEGNYQYTVDVSLDYQVLQIMANLIDQSDTDSYPTVVQIAAGSVMRTFRGTEDLPYFYRYHPFSVVTELPDPLLSKSTSVSFNTPGGPRVLQSCEPLPATGLNKAGKVVALYVPEVWNPHDAGTRIAASANRPARFRLSVITDDPALPTPQTTAWEAGIKSQMSADWYDDVPPKASIPQATTALIDPVVGATAPGATATASTALTFGDDGGKLFREPTLLWHADAPANINLAAEVGSLAGPYTDINSGGVYFGVWIGQNPVSYTGTVDHVTYPASPQADDDKYLFQATSIPPVYKQPIGSYKNYTFRLQYQDPNNSANWITYDEKYPDIHGLYPSQMVLNKADYPRSQWADPLPNRTNQLSDSATGYDPRTARFGVGTSSEFNDGVMVLDHTAAANYNADNDAGNLSMTSSKFTVLVTQRPYADIGSKVKYSNPGMSSDENGGKNLRERWFSGRGWNATANAPGAGGWPLEYDGVLFGQNNPAIKMPQRDPPGTYNGSNYYEDADGVARRAMGAYAYLASSGILPTVGTTANLEGLPHATANAYPNDSGVGTPTAQSLSRPLMLNRPFRSVGEMSSAFRGTPWKQLDFFTPESGDAALLDVFCVNETPADAVVAGKVNLNTHQGPVLQAIVAGTARDELANVSAPPSYALTQSLTNDEAGKVAAKLVGITTDTTHAWRGPLINVADLVGRFVNTTPGTNTGETDFYTFNETVTGKNYTYAGLSAALDASVYTTASNQTARIQRMRESAIRALADSGQTRVWNLLIDVVAQSGRYAPNASQLAQFSVDGETRFWVHVAIDRATGEVIDRQIEVVSE